MKIKFNNIRDLSDARYAAAVMAECIGFAVGSDNDLPASTIQEIIGWCAGPDIILEIGPEATVQKIETLLNLIPVSGLEVEETAFSTLKAQFASQQLTWIVKTSNPIADAISHVPALVVAENTYCSVIPTTKTAEILMSNEPWGISIDCFESVSTGIKDFSEWNDFFEALEIL